MARGYGLFVFLGLDLPSEEIQRVPTDDQSSSPAAGAATAAPPAPDAQSAPAAVTPRDMWRLEDVLADSNIPEGDDAGVSNGDTEQATAAKAEPTSDDKPALSTDEGVKASDAPGPGEEADPTVQLSRRQREAAEKDARIAALEAQLAERDPEKLREQFLAEQAQRAAETVDEDFLGNQERFESLKARPYASLSAEEADWLDLREERRGAYSPVEKHFKSIYDRKASAFANQTVAQATADRDAAIEAGWEQIKTDQGRQIAASSKLPGVDPQAFLEKGANWQTMAEHIHAAGAAWKEAELAERVTKAEAEAATLRQQLKDAGADALGNRRAPAVVGRSAGAAPNGNGFDPSLGWQGNLAGAFDFGTNGSS